MRVPSWAVIRDARRRQHRRLKRRALLLVALATVTTGLLTQRSAGGLQSSPPPIRVDTTRIGGHLGELQASATRVWALTCVQLCGAGDTGLDREQLVAVRASTGAVIRRLPLLNAIAFTIAGRSIWVAHFVSGEITRIDPANGRITARIDLRLRKPIAGHDREFLPDSMSFADGYVWVSTARGWIAQIDARTARLVRMVRTPSEANATTTDRYGTWVAEDLDGVGLLTPGTRRLKLQAVEQAGWRSAIDAVTSGGGLVWAVGSVDDTVNRSTVAILDPRRDRVLHEVHTPAIAGAVYLDGALYLGDLAHGRIYRVSSSGSLSSLKTPRIDAFLASSSPDTLWAATDASPGRLLHVALARG